MPYLQLPGLIDVHTHLRVPGGEHKEDFASGTAAALAGGITLILGMPNTSPPLATPEQLAETRQIAQQTIRCDVGLFAAASPSQIKRLGECANYAVALKIYLNDTFGSLRVEDVPTLRHCFQEWPHQKMIAMHAEKQSVAVGIGLAATYQRPVHFCHISRKEEIELIADAKMAGLPVTCEVTPHHLWLDQSAFARRGALADMRPVLGTPEDVASLWEHLSETVDCIATDHAPHTLAEKRSANPPPGVAGLETSLPLMLTAVHAGRLSLERLITLMCNQPRRIFGLPAQPDSWVEVDVDAEWMINDDHIWSKCGWTPFAGTPVRGRVERVYLRNQLVYEAGQILAMPGSGQLIPEKV